MKKIWFFFLVFLISFIASFYIINKSYAITDYDGDAPHCDENKKNIPNKELKYSKGPSTSYCTFNVCQTLGGQIYCTPFSKAMDPSSYWWSACEKDKATYKAKYGLCTTTTDCCPKGSVYPSTKCDYATKTCKVIKECGKQECASFKDCCKQGQTYPYYGCADGACINVWDCGISTCKPSENKWNPATQKTENAKCSVRYNCNTSNYQCEVGFLGGSYASLSDCQRLCKKPEPRPTPTIPVTGPGSTPVVTKVTPPVTVRPLDPTACVVSGFDIDPRTLGLLSISFGKKFSSVWFTNGDCSYCELWMLPVSASTGEPKKQADGYTDMEYVKVGSDLPIYSGNFGSEIPYYFTNKTRGDYKYKLRCYGSDSVDETWPIQIRVLPLMIWYEVPGVMPTSQFHNIEESPSD